MHTARAVEHVSLQLKWHHQFQFAGYYAAQAKGFYEHEGLAVDIIEGGPTRPPTATVLAGTTQFGISDSDVVRERLNGKPIVACAAIFQHSPYIILSRHDRNIRTPSDLVGKRVMLSGDQGSAQLYAMLLHEGVPIDRVHLLPHSWKLSDLVEGRVDAISAYAMVEPAQLLKLGVEPSSMTAVDYGVDFYGDTLFTSEQEVAAHPARVTAFVRASLRGWDYAMAHPEEITDLIMKMKGVTERGGTREVILQQAAGMRDYILPDVVEIGHMNLGRWQTIANTFVKFGMGPKNVSLDGFLLNTDPERDTATLKNLLGFGIAALAVAALAILWNFEMRRLVNRRTNELQLEVQQRQQTERRLQSALSDSERFRTALDQVPSYVYMKDTDGRYTYANRITLELFGCSATELVGRGDESFFPPETAKRLREIDSNVFKGQQSKSELDAPDLPNGRRVYWEVKTPILSAIDPEVVTGLLGISTDITERKSAEDLVRKHEREYRDLIEHLPAGIVVHGTDTRILYANPMAADLLGLSSIELYGQVAADHVGSLLDEHGSPVSIENLPVNRVLASKEAIHGQILAVQRPGSERPQWAICNGFPVLNSSGEVVQAIISFVDITSLKEAEEALRASEAAQRHAAEVQTAILNSLPAHVALLDQDAQIVAVNESWRRFTTVNGLVNDDLSVGHNYFEVCKRTVTEGAQKAQEVLDGLRDVLDGRLNKFIIDYASQSADGAGWIRLMACPLHEYNRDGAVVMHINVTERKLAEEKIRTQLKELERWQRVTLGREERIQTLKREVNECLRQFGLPPRYAQTSEAPIPNETVAPIAVNS